MTATAGEAPWNPGCPRKCPLKLRRPFACSREPRYRHQPGLQACGIGQSVWGVGSRLPRGVPGVRRARAGCGCSPIVAPALYGPLCRRSRWDCRRWWLAVVGSLLLMEVLAAALPGTVVHRSRPYHLRRDGCAPGPAGHGSRAALHSDDPGGSRPHTRTARRRLPLAGLQGHGQGAAGTRRDEMPGCSLSLAGVSVGPGACPAHASGALASKRSQQACCLARRRRGSGWVNCLVCGSPPGLDGPTSWRAEWSDHGVAC